MKRCDCLSMYGEHDCELYRFAAWYEYMLMQGLAKQTKIGELQESFTPTRMVQEWDRQKRKETEVTR
jgi:hypothetical protein